MGTQNGHNVPFLESASLEKRDAETGKLEGSNMWMYKTEP